jgi:predicted RecB family nuclease
VERLLSKRRGKAAHFIAIHFVAANKLSKDAKLLLAFDALALSEMLGQEVSLGKIIHGDNHATLRVKTSALALDVRKHIANVAALLSSPSPPDLVLIPHYAECEFQTRCRQKALENDDLSLLSGMTEKERNKLHDKGINWGTPCPQRKSGPERGSEEVNCDFLEADFWTVSLE